MSFRLFLNSRHILLTPGFPVKSHLCNPGRARGRPSSRLSRVARGAPGDHRRVEAERSTRRRCSSQAPTEASTRARRRSRTPGGSCPSSPYRRRLVSTCVVRPVTYRPCDGTHPQRGTPHGRGSACRSGGRSRAAGPALRNLPCGPPPAGPTHRAPRR